ncbi:MAG TPA: hypothetical protein VE546_06715 [Streptomyces sp.]|uniref:hypothetical protein n=1 Tax=Streptomyces sp. TaxID=1931 RepID=UPI002D26E8D9|nr:hypothetical protein [Streptomyces sp.]HZG03247.1 hypothetical protein [Streptomyces sp.]
MRGTAITLLACAMVLLPAPVALASQHPAAVAAAPGTSQGGVEPRAETPTPTPSPTDDEPPRGRPSHPTWPTLPPWPPEESAPAPSPTPTPTPTPSSSEPSGEPSGTPSEREEDEGDREDARPGLREPARQTSAGRPDEARQTPRSWTDQVSDRRAGTVDDYDYGDDEYAREQARTDGYATPATGQLLPVLPLGAGLTFLGLGLASLALRLRR